MFYVNDMHGKLVTYRPRLRCVLRVARWRISVFVCMSRFFMTAISGKMRRPCVREKRMASMLSANDTSAKHAH